MPEVSSTFLTVGEVAAILKLSPDQIEGCAARGELRIAQIAGERRIYRRHLDEFIDLVVGKGPPRPPEPEILAFLDQCVAVPQDQATAEQLESAGIPADRVRRYDLARAIASDAHCPPWARSGRATWWAHGYRLVVPLWDAKGRVRSVRACRLGPASASAGADPVDPAKGAEPWKPIGLVMADLAFLALLRHPSIPPGDHRYAAEAASKHGIVVACGVRSYLLQATTVQEKGFDRAPVVGVLAGAWTADLAAAVPAGCAVRILEDEGSGEHAAEEVLPTLRARGCECDIIAGTA
jgi:excisionase family DNA binding protein